MFQGRRGGIQLRLFDYVKLKETGEVRRVSLLLYKTILKKTISESSEF
jgi:hypothetical protein